jgi:hypothetical protein
MISLKLVRLIEEHKSELADEIVGSLHSDPRTKSLQRIPAPELRERIQATLCQFHAWLLTSVDHNVQEHYRDLGRHHAAQDVTLPDLCWAIVLIKERLWHFVERRALHTTSVEIHAELELIRFLDLFFDGAICHVAEGYECVRNEMRAPEQPSGPRMPLIPSRPRWLRSVRGSGTEHGNG